MKRKNKIINIFCGIIFLIQLSSCNNTSTGIEKTIRDTSRPKEFRKEEIADSLTTVRTLDLALKIAMKNKTQDKFTFHSDSLEINYGYLFSKTIKHLIIKMNFQRGVFANIYKLKDNSFEEVCSKDIMQLAYIGDTIQDVNGDGQLDYLFHWYPPSGCCARDIFDVYLQETNGNFFDEFEFINLTFSPKEKVVRGRCYGREAPFYKYKWNGSELDTIEYIFVPDSTNGNNYVRKRHEDEKEKGIVLKQLPDEYKKLGDFE